ncbi:FeoB-associated Cys-rich membrane protein [Halarcobacter ebronensis]|uniref:FeoB-associated Cys-rich membrane protein n=1 Tax=Halarcobacter ebronensis TaxID=1462615 RepID=A0A4Q1API2_9BACT|nr:FeoB-associated Cys-rich membrane protein [Halarcobacter ebronensis]QKF81298.1 hypothetical protein AEBR_0798 [Halarcobacter ebronensis]RXJ67657.1 FeoB-associated Cys-rich membrane protein [Halarcobacter ebronensis]RXK04863.1 FeoB-associated Cys-rich membrane protein [Halarcobacter ebronensis]
MEDFILLIIALLALFYIYKKLFKSGSCNCGSKNCSSKK